ncbi:MAG: O-antigen ligase family protein [Sphingomonadaceae bacterium]
MYGVVILYKLVEIFWFTSPVFNDFTINSLALCAGILCRSREGKLRLYWQFVGATIVLLAAYARAGPIFIILSFVVFYHFSIAATLVRIFATVLIFFPLVIYLSIDDATMLSLKEIDFNTYIRAEFIRGALPTFLEAPLFGSGFEVPYRDVRYAGYLVDHPLLRVDFRADFVSNHHSIFDIALRLGIFGAGLFYFLTVLRPGLLRSEQWRSFLLVALAQGFGMNAWFENQNQLIQAILILALLNTDIVKNSNANLRAPQVR